MVRREEDEADRRLVRNYLTETGEYTCNRVGQGVGAYIRTIMGVMDPADVAALLQGMSALVQANDCVLRVHPDLAAVAMP